MISDRLLEILRCPETKQSLRRADDSAIARVNARIEAGEARTTGGERVTESIEAGLVRDDGTALYPMRMGIPILLQDEAILLLSEPAGPDSGPSAG